MSLLVEETSDFQYWRYVITLPRFRMSPYGGALQTGPRAFCMSYSPHTGLPSRDYYRLSNVNLHWPYVNTARTEATYLFRIATSVRYDT